MTPLPQKSIAKLISRWQRKGDTASRNTVVESNMGLVYLIANKKRPNGSDIADIVQEGVMGMMKAVDMYDPKHKTNFTTYAAFWVKAYISRYIERDSFVVATHSHIKPRRYRDVSLEDSIGDLGKTLSDVLVSDLPMPDRRAEISSLRSAIKKAAKGYITRTELHKRVLEERILAIDPDTLQEIGKSYGVSRERIRQIECEIRRKLAVALKPLAEVA